MRTTRSLLVLLLIATHAFGEDLVELSSQELDTDVVDMDIAESDIAMVEMSAAPAVEDEALNSSNSSDMNSNSSNGTETAPAVEDEALNSSNSSDMDSNSSNGTKTAPAVEDEALNSSNSSDMDSNSSNTLAVEDEALNSSNSSDMDSNSSNGHSHSHSHNHSHAHGAEHGLDQLVAAIDPEADKCTDFYQYACGTWLNHTSLPDDQATFTKTFHSIGNKNFEFLNATYSRHNDSKTEYLTVSAAQVNLVRDFYASCMDVEGRDARGITDPEFVSLMDEIEAVDSLDALLALHGERTLKGIGSGLFSFGVGADAMVPKQNIAIITQGGLGLPSPEYYTTPADPQAAQRMAAVQAGYTSFITNALLMSNVITSNTSTLPGEILDFETAIANFTWGQMQMQDPLGTYNPETIASFLVNHPYATPFFDAMQSSIPAFAYRNATMLADNATMNQYDTVATDALVKMNVQTPSFFAAMGDLLAATSLSTVKAYMKFHFVKGAMPWLTEGAGELNFRFYGQGLQGQKSRAALWKRCVSATLEATWGMADKMYVEEKFPNSSKTLAEDMVAYIKAAFAARLDATEFMDFETSVKATAKLAAMRSMVGFPSAAHWPTYEALVVGTSFFSNSLSSKEVEATRMLTLVGTRTEPKKWHMNPSEVNAYYAPTKNLIVFPAGVLQSPFFCEHYPMVMNFGAIGSVMGHEITHGFDNIGAMYNADGALHMWWSEESITAFKTKLQCVQDQYSNMSVPELSGVQDDLGINGKLTLGENVADMGGAMTSLAAYRQWQQDKGTPTNFTVGNSTFTDEELFWIAYGQSWCAVQSPEALMMQLRTDPHSPSRARTMGVAQNSVQFSTAMQCGAQTPMNPDTKCKVW